ncbi:hypothetical protein BH09ACT6_BH09ACT6_15140 [soil metagenome]
MTPGFDRDVDGFVLDWNAQEGRAFIFECNEVTHVHAVGLERHHQVNIGIRPIVAACNRAEDPNLRNAKAIRNFENLVATRAE